MPAARAGGLARPAQSRPAAEGTRRRRRVSYGRRESYNQPVSERRLISAAALVALFVVAPAAQTPTLDEVLKRCAAYVADFHKQLSGIVAEEDYRQDSTTSQQYADAVQAAPARRLKSDLLLVKPADSTRYVELRDVFEVDG